MDDPMNDPINPGSVSQLLANCREHVSVLRRVSHRRGLLGDKSVLACAFFSTLLGPIVFSVILTMKPQAPVPGWYWLVLGFVGLIQLLLGIIALLGARELGKLGGALASVEELSVLLSALQQTTERLLDLNEGTKGLLRTAVEQVTAIGTSLPMLRVIIGTDEATRDAKESVDTLLNPVMQDRIDVLTFRDPNDLYNIAVYRWSEDLNSLECLFRACDDRIDRQDRSWKAGQGHVGTCFTKNKTLITPDVESAIEFLSDDRDRDLRLYRSIAAFPIYGRDAQGAPSADHSIGVLVLTSSLAGHFHEGYRVFGEIYAELLAMCLDHLSPRSPAQ